MTSDRPYEFDSVRPSVGDVDQCRYSLWSVFFPDHVVPAVTIRPLPPAFIEYLLSDTIKLPGSHQPIVATSDNEYSDWEQSDDDTTASDNGAVDNGAVQDVTAAFAAMHGRVVAAIRDLGPVFPKMNWSAPKDAKWMLPNNVLQCHDASDVYLVLNASSHIVHDVEHAYAETGEDKQPDDFELVLRQWTQMNPALEFRVFVFRGSIIGVSQRDPNYYDYLANLEPRLRLQIDQFFATVFRPSHFPLDTCVLDVYIPRPFDKTWLVDINPFSRAADPLLFTWNELLTRSRDESRDSLGSYELRLIRENNIHRSAAKDHSENQVPLDVIGAAHDTEAMVELARAWNQPQNQPE